MKSAVIRALLLVCLVTVSGFAKTIYVRKTGSDGNTCTTAQSGSPATSAKLTIVNAITNCIVGGDTLIIGDGIYIEQVLNIIPSGSSVAPTIIRAENRRQVIVAPNATSDFFVFFLQDRNWITIDGIVADAGTAGAGVNGSPYEVEGDTTSSHITIQHGTARNAHINGTYGMLLGGGFHQVIDMDIYHNVHPTVTDGSAGYGIYLAGHDSLLDGNRIYDGTGYGVHQYRSLGGSDNNVIRNNVIHNQGLGAAFGIILSSGSGNTAYNNILYSNIAGIQVRYSCSGCSVYNNTIHNNSGYCVNIFNDSSGTIARNNICWANTNNTILNNGTGTTQDHNLCASGCAVSTNPMFVDTTTNDYRLMAGSPAINVGTVIASVPNDIIGTTRGTNPDLGAYEYFVQASSFPLKSIFRSIVVR